MSEIICIKKEAQEYPALLHKIPDPPERLYCRGRISLLDTFCISIVGTRRASDYGVQACRQFAGELARAGVTVVSGLALGLDAVAHRATLEAGGATVAVLGSGVSDEDIGPPSNLPLARDILAGGGLLVSESPGNEPYHPGTFPRRNRIISGLSRGVLVIEADKDSGSIITTDCALEQDRDVFAVPGSIYWPRSAGTNWLIREGARPALTVSDILDTYRLRQVPLPELARSSTGDPVERAILAVLRSDGPQHLETLVTRADADAGRVMAAVAMLELSGAISHQGSGVYSLKS